MDDLQRVLYGPIQVVWTYSRIADYKVVVEKLQSKLPEGTRVFGVQKRCCCCVDGCYTYQVVLWPVLKGEETESITGDMQSEWRSRLYEVVTELDTLNTLGLEIASREKTKKKKSRYLRKREREREEQQSTWDVKSCGDAVDPVRFVKDFIQRVWLQETHSREGAVFFGRIAFEYGTDRRKWQEVYSGSADGRYVFSLIDVEEFPSSGYVFPFPFSLWSQRRVVDSVADFRYRVMQSYRVIDSGESLTKVI